MAMNMNMKDHMDVSNQENVAPVYFQSLRSSSSLHFLSTFTCTYIERLRLSVDGVFWTMFFGGRDELVFKICSSRSRRSS